MEVLRPRIECEPLQWQHILNTWCHKRTATCFFSTNSNKTLLHWCCLKKFWKGELTMMGGFLFFMYAFLCHLLIYCFLATNVSFLALFCDTGARFFRLFFSFASWLDARPCQQTALERHCKFGRERLFFPSALFFYMVGSGYAGALAVFLDRRMVLGSYTGGSWVQ